MILIYSILILVYPVELLQTIINFDFFKNNVFNAQKICYCSLLENFAENKSEMKNKKSLSLLQFNIL